MRQIKSERDFIREIETDFAKTSVRKTYSQLIS